jgi:hypothetical protein
MEEEIVNNEYFLKWDNGVLGVFTTATGSLLREIAFDCSGRPGDPVAGNIIEAVCRALGVRRAVLPNGGVDSIEVILNEFTSPMRRFNVTFNYKGVELTVEVESRSQDGFDIRNEAVAQLYNDLGVSVDEAAISQAFVLEKA